MKVREIAKITKRAAEENGQVQVSKLTKTERLIRYIEQNPGQKSMTIALAALGDRVYSARLAQMALAKKPLIRYYPINHLAVKDKATTNQFRGRRYNFVQHTRPSELAKPATVELEQLAKDYFWEHQNDSLRDFIKWYQNR